MTLAEIQQNLKDIYFNSQVEITDDTPISVTNNIFFAVSSELERLYSLLFNEKLNVVHATSTGDSLDIITTSLTAGAVTRGKPTHSTGYVVLYANEKTVRPDLLNIKLAKLSEDSTLLENTDNSFRVSGNAQDNNVDKVFIVIEPKNTNYIKNVSGENFLDVRNFSPRFVILPVASFSAGSVNNVGLGEINVVQNMPFGFSGVINTNNLIDTFFAGQLSENKTPLALRVSNVTGYVPEISGILQYPKFNLNNGFLFTSQNSHVVLERKIDGYILYGVYKDSSSTIVQEQILRFPYTVATNTSIELKSFVGNGMPSPTTEFNDPVSGTLVTLTLTDYFYKNLQNNTNTPLVPTNTTFGVLDSSLEAELDTLGNTPNGFLIKESPFLLSSDLILDPDNVLSLLTGELNDSSIISGGSDEENDDSFRLELPKYYQSLATGTSLALERGATSVSGIGFARTLPKKLSPLGVSTVVMSNQGLTVPDKALLFAKNKIEESFKSSGIGLVVKKPKTTKLSILLDIELSSSASVTNQNSLYAEIETLIENYLGEKTPYSSIIFTELSSLIYELSEVKSIKSFIIGKELSDKVYELYKTQLPFTNGYFLPYTNNIAGYDALLLSLMWNSTALHSSNAIWTPNNYSAINVLGDYENTNVLPIDTVWNNISLVLKNVNSSFSFKEFIKSNYSSIFPTNTPLISQYLVVQNLLEPFSVSSGISTTLPSSVERVLQSETKDYQMGIERCELGTIILDGTPKKLLGIRFS